MKINVSFDADELVEISEALENSSINTEDNALSKKRHVIAQKIRFFASVMKRS